MIKAQLGLCTRNCYTIRLKLSAVTTHYSTIDQYSNLNQLLEVKILQMPKQLLE